MSKFTYTTREVADIIGVSKKRLLNWLQTGKVPEPMRNEKNNYREWTALDITFIQKIKKQTSKE